MSDRMLPFPGTALTGVSSDQLDTPRGYDPTAAFQKLNSVAVSLPSVVGATPEELAAQHRRSELLRAARGSRDLPWMVAGEQAVKGALWGAVAALAYTFIVDRMVRR